MDYLIGMALGTALGAVCGYLCGWAACAKFDRHLRRMAEIVNSARRAARS